VKTIDPALQNHLNGDSTTLALCWKVTKRNGDVLFGTDHDQDIIVNNGNYAGIYLAGTTNITGSDVNANSDMTVDNMEVSGAFPDGSFQTTMHLSEITQADIDSGILNYARVVILTLNWQAPNDGQIVLTKGFLGALSYDSSGGYKTEVRGMADLLTQNIGQCLTDKCDVKRFGDARCKFDASTVTVAATVTAVTSRRAFSVGGYETHAEGWFNNGLITGTSGKNAGFKKQIRIDNADGVGGAGVPIQTGPGTGDGTQGSGSTGGGTTGGGTPGGGVGTPGGGGISPTTGLPDEVVSLGLTTQTFGPWPSITNTYLGMYFPSKFFGYTGGTASNDANDETVTMSGGPGQMCTAVLDTTFPGQFRGNAFGGDLYVEAEIEWPRGTGIVSGSWPAFWALPIEGMAYNGPRPETNWPGQDSNYIDFNEWDIMEYLTGHNTQVGFSGLHNWYGEYGVGTQVHTNFPAATLVTGANRFGGLWIHATDTTQGYYAGYLNGVEIHRTSYNKYNPALAPPPIDGSSAYSHGDLLHYAFIFSTNPTYPMTVNKFSVWQRDASQNLQHKEAGVVAPPPTTGGGSTPPTGGTPTTLDLYVSNGKLYNADNTEFRMRGMDVCHYDSAWSQGTNAENSGANTVRIFLPESASAVPALITAAHNQKIIPVLSKASVPGDGGTSGNNSTTDFTSVIDWWVAAAGTLKDLHPLVINIANEWLSGANAATWESSYKTAVQRIRTAGYTQVLMIDTDGYGQDYGTIYSSAAAVLAVDTLKNTMFSYHLYGLTASVADMQTNFAQMKATNLCIVIGEFGPGRNIGPSPTLITPDQVISTAEGNGFSWIAWAWDDNNLAGAKADDNWFSMTTGNVGGVGTYVIGQEDRDLTTFGKDVVAKMKALAVKSTIFGSGFMGQSLMGVQSLEDVGDGAGSADLQLFEPFPYDVAIGDTFEMVAGCDRTLNTCVVKFNNLKNFRGYGVFIPGIDAILQGPVGTTPNI
jgi:uncharacterized phage protein (TIGR02218 family)